MPILSPYFSWWFRALRIVPPYFYFGANVQPSRPAFTDFSGSRSCRREQLGQQLLFFSEPGVMPWLHSLMWLSCFYHFYLFWAEGGGGRRLNFDSAASFSCNQQLGLKQKVEWGRGVERYCFCEMLRFWRQTSRCHCSVKKRVDCLRTRGSRNNRNWSDEWIFMWSGPSIIPGAHHRLGPRLGLRPGLGPDFAHPKFWGVWVLRLVCSFWENHGKDDSKTRRVGSVSGSLSTSTDIHQ